MRCAGHVVLFRQHGRNRAGFGFSSPASRPFRAIGVQRFANLRDDFRGTFCRPSRLRISFSRRRSSAVLIGFPLLLLPLRRCLSCRTSVSDDLVSAGFASPAFFSPSFLRCHFSYRPAWRRTSLTSVDSVGGCLLSTAFCSACWTSVSGRRRLSLVPAATAGSALSVALCRLHTRLSGRDLAGLTNELLHGLRRRLARPSQARAGFVPEPAAGFASCFTSRL